MKRYGIAEIITGLVVLVVAAGFLAYALAHSGKSVGSGYTLYARFASIEGLNVGNDVRIGGVKVGSVSSETLDPKTFEAVVALSVRDDIQLPKDTGAAITSESLLGGKYVSLSPGGDSQNLQAGQTITVTQSAVNIEELLGKFIFSVTSLNGGSKGGQAGTSQAGNSGGGAGSTGGNSGGNGGGLPPLGK